MGILRLIYDLHAAGRTTLEEPDRAGHQRTVVLELHVYAIDNANFNLASRFSNRNLPCYKLGKFERYAEIVGHELAPAALMLEKPEYARLSSELRMETDRYLLALRQASKDLPREPVGRQQQERIRSMIATIEKPAETAELEIWRELVNDHRR